MRLLPASRCLVVFVLSGSGLAQSTWYVDGSGIPPGSGSELDPYTSIQYAIEQLATQSGDTLVVESGLYAENVDFSGKSLALTSAHGPELTILDGSRAGAVVTLASGEGPGTRLEGFTVTGGAGTLALGECSNGGGVVCLGVELEVRDCIVVDNDAWSYCGGSEAYGGGFYAENATLTIRDSVIADNETGGGVVAFDSTVVVTGSAITGNSRNAFSLAFASGLSLVSCSTSISDCDISRNGQLPYADQGGGIAVEGGTLDLQDSTLVANLACFRGGALALTDGRVTIERSTIVDSYSVDDYWGGGIYVDSEGAPELVVRDTTLSGNRGGDGGGAYIGGGSATFESCLFSENRAYAFYYLERGTGGAICVAGGASVLVSRSVFRDNQADGNIFEWGGKGGAVFGPAILDHCTLVSNRAILLGPDHETPEGGATLGCTLRSSIVWGNQPDDLDSTSTAEFSCIKGGWPGPGNIGLDPGFWDRDAQDYHLAPGSPCIGTGADSSDMGAFPFDPTYCGEGCSSEIGTRTCSPAVPNSSGEPGTMIVTGSETVADDDLSLWALGLPAGKNIGYFIMGTGSNTFTPPGSAGPVCVAPGIRRFLPLIVDTSTELAGGFGRDVGTSGPVSGQITAGSTWGFQAWHRDGNRPSNFTDAVTVTFR